MTTTAMNPLPSLIRASSWDAANMRMRAAGRSKWNKGDYNHACDTQERLITACYGRQNDENQPNIKFIRFAIAEQMEKARDFTLSSKMPTIWAAIEEALAA